MNYYLIKFWVINGIDSSSVTRLVKAITFKAACNIIKKSYSDAYDFENLTLST